VFITTSLPYMLELGNPSVTKGSGIAFVATMLGLDLANVVAFGDGENDVELLDWASYAVAVANAHERVLEVANFVCPPVNDEGVAQVLEAFLESQA
jgi:hydroxymethylpyrimidine pyrophosphatase-like HAD family hydrolase